MRLAIVLLVACSHVEPVQMAAPVKPTTATLALGPPPAALGLSATYVKYIDAGGLPIVGSARVSDHALLEARYLALQMIGHRPEVLRAMADNHVRFVAMATTELTTDVPEHSDLTPKAYWDRRARGLGATDARPAVSSGEENLLGIEGDPYSTESIFVHEFSHAIHEMGMRTIDRTFDERLRAAYEHARTAKLWEGTYAATNAAEYWAEGTQSWFDTNRVNDSEHGAIGTRAQVIAYDEELTELLLEVFGDRPWRYVPVARRTEADRAHLAGFDPRSIARFQWPPEIAAEASEIIKLDPIDRRVTPSGASGPTSVLFTNRRAVEVSVLWVDRAGMRVHYLALPPGTSQHQPTFVGHVWIVREGARDLGMITARAAPTHVVIE